MPRSGGASRSLRTGSRSAERPLVDYRRYQPSRRRRARSTRSAKLAERAPPSRLSRTHPRASRLPSEPSDARGLRLRRRWSARPISFWCWRAMRRGIRAFQQPPAGCRVVHIGEDPAFVRYPMRSFPSDLSIAATRRGSRLSALEARSASRRHSTSTLRRADADRAPRHAPREGRRRSRRAERHARRRDVQPRASANAVGEDAIIFNEYPLQRSITAAREARHFTSALSAGRRTGLGPGRRARRKARRAGETGRRDGRRRRLHVLQPDRGPLGTPRSSSCRC